MEEVKGMRGGLLIGRHGELAMERGGEARDHQGLGKLAQTFKSLCDPSERTQTVVYWNHGGSIWEASERHLVGTWEASVRYLGGTWEASGGIWGGIGDQGQPRGVSEARKLTKPV